MRQLSIGVIGCGGISQGYHLPALAQVKAARLAAVADVQPEEARKAAEAFKVPAWYDDPQALLADPDVEAVLILTPNWSHAELAVAAAQAGKHLMVQKPLARNEAEAQSILDAAASAGVRLVPSFMHRFLPEVLRAKDYIDQGILGRVHTVRIRNATPGASWADWFYHREKVGGGAVIDIGCHGIDLLRWLVGEVSEVFAYTDCLIRERLIQGRRVVPDNEDTGVALYQLENGGYGVHEISWTQHKGAERFEMEIYGEEGTILMRTGRGPLAVSSQRLDPPGQWLIPDLENRFKSHGVVHHEDTVQAILEGPTPLTPTPEDGLMAVRVCECIYESATSGQPVTVPRAGS